jgi:hypothetical protein
MGSLVCSWLRIVDENNEDESDVDEHDDDENDDGRGAKRQRVDTPNSLSVKNSGSVNYNNTASDFVPRSQGYGVDVFRGL